MASNDVLPQHSKSKRGRSSNPATDHISNVSPTLSNSTPRTARPSLASRTSSAPLLPAIKVKSPNLLSGEGQVDDVDLYSVRDSVASIKDDPFFRNYQTPISAALARELRSAAYSERLRDGKSPHDPPPQSPNTLSVDNSVNLPVSPSP
jgi:hypothetical protein